VRELIEMVGLGSVARKRAGTFSLGMGQRLGIASALSCDPRTVMFDEPVNGLDVEGIQWVRSLLKRLAAEGRTVFVYSHLMSEMAQTAEHLIVIGRGQLLADMGWTSSSAAPLSSPCCRAPRNAEPLRDLRRQPRRSHTLGRQPTAQPRQQPHLLAHRHRPESLPR
jgi:ABC-2 type transport system ATP-binding protein